MCHAPPHISSFAQFLPFPPFSLRTLSLAALPHREREREREREQKKRGRKNRKKTHSYISSATIALTLQQQQPQLTWLVFLFLPLFPFPNFSLSPHIKTKNLRIFRLLFFSLFSLNSAASRFRYRFLSSYSLLELSPS